MTRTALSISAAAFACLLLSTPSNAAANRSFVSALGNDANPCSISQPCRTMQAAFNATAPDGEIDVLDPTGYGSLMITHGVSIQGHGWASMNAAAGANVITVNAGPNDKINLRGLIIEGFGTGQHGIFFNSGKSLVVEDTIIRNLVGNGITFKPNTSSALAVSNTTIADNAHNGIVVRPTGPIFHHAVFDKVRAYNNPVSGITIDDSEMPSGRGQIIATASDCVVSDVSEATSTGIGYLAVSHLFVVNFAVHRSVSTGYGTGLEADGFDATLAVSETFVDNNAQVSAGSGFVLSYGDNFSNSATIQRGGSPEVTK
jgi:hypothetical protein